MSWERLTVVAFDFWTRSFSLDHLRTEPVVCGVARSVEFKDTVQPQVCDQDCTVGAWLRLS